MRIRLAEKTDIESIANLHAASWRFAYRGALSDDYLAGDIVSDRKAVWTQRLTSQNPNQYVIIAERDTELLGFACAFSQSDSLWGTMLDNIHVSQSSHRHGVGTALLRNIAKWQLDSHGATPLFLWVLQSNTNAQKFYEALGADNVGSDFWTPPDGGAVPRYRYAWKNVDVFIKND